MIAKCSKCHHEWQAVGRPGRCDWCGAPGRQLATDYIESDWLERTLNAVLGLEWPPCT